MPTPPNLAAVKAYLGTEHSWSDTEVEEARLAELGNQLAVCRVPVDPDPQAPLPYPADLDEALCRRVAHNLALRRLPLGVQANFSDTSVATNRVGGLDAEVARLEGPWRKVLLG